MGWTFTNREKGTSNLTWFRREFCPTEPERLIDMATKNGTAYGALRVRSGEVRAIVILTRWVPKDYYNFGYKDMDESMGPSDDDCPKRIYDLLTPLTEDDNEWSAEWRQRVEERLARPKVKKGMRLRWTPEFWRGGPYGICEYLGGSGRNLFRTEYGNLVIFNGWRSMPYEVIT